MRKSAKEKILEFFKDNINIWIAYKKIAKVAGISDWARQVRALRQEGWKIEKMGGSIKTKYRLTSTIKGEGKKRDYINNRLRAKILLRDNYRCIHCGKNPKEDEIKLHIDHKIPVEWGGETTEDNLQTLCSDCNLGKKAYFADFNNEIMKNILKEDSGTQRLLILASNIVDKPLDVNFIGTIAGIRDWTRTIRMLRQKGKIDYEINRKNNTYTFRAVD